MDAICRFEWLPAAGAWLLILAIAIWSQRPRLRWRRWRMKRRRERRDREARQAREAR